MMQYKHFTNNYLLNPSHPVSVTVIGAGGTGGQVIQRLARINIALMALGHPGLYVKLFDDDIVQESNLARQLFTINDIGRYKSIVLIERVNRFYGFQWDGISFKIDEKLSKETYNQSFSNIIITCTDSIESRKFVYKTYKIHNNSGFNQRKVYYWMDFGNSQTVAQVIIGQMSDNIQKPNTKILKTVNNLYKNYFKQKTITGNSCSIAESLDKQDLFINSTIAEFGCNLIWKMFIDAGINYQGVFVNLETTEISKVLIQ